MSLLKAAQCLGSSAGRFLPKSFWAGKDFGRRQNVELCFVMLSYVLDYFVVFF